MSGRKRWSWAVVCAVAATSAVLIAADGRSSITTAELRDWLTYIASDELEGRAVYTEGLGLAAGYIQDHLKDWGLGPRGDGGYLQTVRVEGIKTTSRSSVTVQVGRETRTFKDGEGITFPRDVGSKRMFTVDRVEFAGYGLDAPGAHYSDLAGRDYRNAAVVYLGNNGPQAVEADMARRLMSGRGRWLTEQAGAVAAIGPTRNDFPPPPPQTQQNRNARQVRPDFTTTQRLDRPIAPSVSANDAFFQFLFSRAPVRYDELKKKAEGREPLQGFALDGVKLTFNLDDDYQVVRTQFTQNIVAIVEGTDAQLKSTYVAMGAHYDHVGYAESELTSDSKRPQAPGRVTEGAEADRIWNGADDDGSGTVVLMALARAFAQGPRPRRSLLFVWHAGEERGLLGSRYFADHPTVPLDHVMAQLNIDMVGRNRDNQAGEANTVYVVGSDRISSELRDVNRDANHALEHPLTLDYEMNDPADPEQLYFRSDHYSYASKGIPIIFFTTGLHPDYHANTDEVSRIEFPKMTRVAQLVYETAWRLANLDHPLVRDFKGPRAGKGTRD